MGREELLSAAAADPSTLDGVAALDVRGNFMFDPANHRDFWEHLLAQVGEGRGRLRRHQHSRIMGCCGQNCCCGGRCRQYTPRSFTLSIVHRCCERGDW